MTQEQTRRVQQSLNETIVALIAVEKQKMFDDHQEAEKAAKIKFYSQHINKLADMLVSNV